MFVIGLTGGIGSGKTAATDHFKTLGIDIIDADIASRVVVEAGTPALEKIAEHFGSGVLLADQSLNRAALRTKIFAESGAKQWLEALLHPLIADEILRALSTASSPYAIFVSPLLIESQQIALCDRILVIDVPEELQLQRTVSRDNNDEDQVKRIIATQASRQQRLDKADDIIENTQGLVELQEQIEDLHQRYLEMAAL